MLKKEDLFIFVSDIYVTLDGEIEDEYSGQSIEDIAEDIMGVKNPHYSVKKQKMYEAEPYLEERLGAYCSYCRFVLTMVYREMLSPGRIILVYLPYLLCCTNRKNFVSRGIFEMDGNSFSKF